MIDPIADVLFSELIRERANWRCEACSRKVSDKGELHCAHFYNRWNLSVRYNEDNALALCYECHAKTHAAGGRDMLERLIYKRLGRIRREDLKRASLVLAVGYVDKRALRANLRAKIRKLKNDRSTKSGLTGVI